ncbi:MAG: MarR family transcriptional regulator [Deltaproteobacteria bacterium]|nr:MarR family transcriptional regulator [Deltaproteobacteria bacterium]
MGLKVLARQIVECYEKLSIRKHETATVSGLPPRQMHIVEIIDTEKSLRIKELVKELCMTPETLIVTVGRFEKRHIERKPHEADRRSFCVVLSAAGQKHFIKHHKFHLKLTEDIASGIV